MNIKALNKPLTDAELIQLDDFLSSIDDPFAMNMEMLDGYFVALICGPEILMPGDYLAHTWGDDFTFSDDGQAREILNLLLRHWNTVTHGLLASLETENAYLPVLMKDDEGVASGNDWAQGFMCGVMMRRGSWIGLLDDKKYSKCLVPILMLFHEHNTEPKLRPPPILPEDRKEIFGMIILAINQVYRYFAPHRKRGRASVQLHQITPKVGRNNPCPCGSGKKYKHCCGGTAQSPH